MASERYKQWMRSPEGKAYAAERYKEYVSTENGLARRREAALRYYYRNKEAILAKQKERTSRNKRAHFNLSNAEFAAMLEAQGGVCAICGTPEPGGKGWALDHDHSMDQRDKKSHRGVLCPRCNLILGHAKDAESILASAIGYLERWRRRREGGDS